MNVLELYFRNNPGHEINKWRHYFEIYERHFSSFRGTPVVILEIGVAHGGSLEMWRHYFGDTAQVIGVDCNPVCKQLEQPGISIEIGDQANERFWAVIRAKYPRIDIVVDDGGHRPEQQTITFEQIFWHLSEGGVFLCEDLHTNYWRRFGSEINSSASFVEYTKRLVDQLTLWHSEDQHTSPITDFTRSAWSIHYYNSVVVIEKRKNVPPTQSTIGKRAY